MGVSPRLRTTNRHEAPGGGDRHLSVPRAADITAIFLSPLRGFLNIFSFVSWGSRPRLCICHRSAARNHMTTFRQDLTNILCVGEPVLHLASWTTRNTGSNNKPTDHKDKPIRIDLCISASSVGKLVWVGKTCILHMDGGRLTNATPRPIFSHLLTDRSVRIRSQSW